MVLVWSEPENFNGKWEGWEPEISSYPHKFGESRRTVLWQGPRLISKPVGIPVGATLTLRGRDDVSCVVVALNPPEICVWGRGGELERSGGEGVWQGTGRNDDRILAISGRVARRAQAAI